MALTYLMSSGLKAYHETCKHLYIKKHIGLVVFEKEQRK